VATSTAARGPPRWKLWMVDRSLISSLYSPGGSVVVTSDPSSVVSLIS
jgi:hypothetical protein